jgi:hypothetical protein
MEESGIAFKGGGMTIHRAFSIGVAAIATALFATLFAILFALGSAGPAMAQACTHDGPRRDVQ